MDNNYECRVVYYSQLLCPNPGEYYRMTKVIKKEDYPHQDLAVIKLASILSQNRAPFLWPYVIIFFVVLGLLVSGCSKNSHTPEECQWYGLFPPDDCSKLFNPTPDN